MALVKYGPAIADARGSVGGTVFTRNRFGAVMKQRTTPKYSGYDKQVEMTTLMTQLASSWATALTVSEREAFNNAALLFTVPNALGEQVHLTGMQFFIKCNMLLTLTDQVVITVPPATAIAPAPTLTLAHTPATGIECTAIGIWDNTAADKLLCSVSAPLPQTVNYFKGPWARTWGQNGSYFSILPALMLPSVELQVDTRMFGRWRVVNADGSASFPAIFLVDVGDPV